MTKPSPGVRATYDEQADVLGISLDRTVRAMRVQQLASNVRADWDKNGRLLFIEVLFASEWYPVEHLKRLASPAVDLTLKEAAKRSGLTASTLKDQILKRRMVGRKVGRDWVVTAADLETYLVNRAPQGKPATARRARRPKAQPA